MMADVNRVQERAHLLEAVGPERTALSNGLQAASASRRRQVDAEHSLQSEITKAPQEDDLSNMALNPVVVDTGDAEQTFDDTLSTRSVNLNSKKGTTIRWPVYQYSIEFVPDEDRTQVRKKLLVQAYKDKLAGFIFNRSKLFTLTPIQPNLLLAKLQADSGAAQKIILRRMSNLDDGDYDLSRVINIVIRNSLEILREKLAEHYGVLTRVKIPEYVLDFIPECSTRINLHESKILMRCEMHKYLASENIFKIYHQCLRQDVVNYKRNFERLLIGCYVLTSYNNRTYRIDDVDWQQTVTDFTNRRTCVSYKDCYMQKYKINVSLNPQPILVSRAKPRELRIGMPEIKYLVPELCRLAVSADKLSVKKTNIQVAPEKLSQCSVQRSSTLRSEIRKWQIDRFPTVSDRDRIRSNNLILPELDNIWAVLCPVYLKPLLHPFLESLRRYSCSLQLNLPYPPVYDMVDDGPLNYLKGIESVMQKYKPKLILCVLNRISKTKYELIEKKCSIERAVLSQIITKNNMDTKHVIYRITKQINAKLGRVHWPVQLPGNLMVIGLDVRHDTSDPTKSYSAIVSALDNQNTRYFCIVSTNKTDEELSKNLKENILKCVTRYQSVNRGRMPAQIIIYRNGGIRDGQLTYVFKHEVEVILNTLEKHYKEKPVKFAFIVIPKRMKTKTFELPDSISNEEINARYSFYTVKQESTYCVMTNCTRYQVVYDTLGFLPRHVQYITYKYARLGILRMPCPCHYARKLACFVSHSLHRDPHPELSDTLFFL